MPKNPVDDDPNNPDNVEPVETTVTETREEALDNAADTYEKSQMSQDDVEELAKELDKK
jgi:hypothetical protein